MCSLGDDDAEIEPMEDKRKVDFTLNDTQPFDSQNFPTSLPGEKGGDDNEVQLLQSNVLFGDTVPLEDAFETQIVDLGVETQVLDYPDCLEFMETQLIDEFNNDCEGIDKTEVLDDGDDNSDVDSCGRGKSESLDVEMSRRTSLELSKKKMMEARDEYCCFGCNVSTETPQIEVSKQPEPGSVQRFTSVRTASLRASGLAARKAFLEKTNSRSCSLLSDNQHSEKQAVRNNGSNTEVSEGADQVCNTGRYNDEVKELINGNTTKFGRSTVRKLFCGDNFVENEMFSSLGGNNVWEREMVQLPTCDDVLAGLSYIDSQEPGESSQANALACVERLIEENRELFDNEFDLAKNSKGKSNLSSSAKGPQSLAKKTNDRGAYVKSAIFDWDDGQEDEGGGDIFRRRKEEFFGGGNAGGKSLTKQLKAKGNQVDGYRDCKGKSDVQNEIIAHPDSKTVVDNLKLNDKRESETEMNVANNLVNEFDKESNRATLATELKATELLDVGLDTQMAAEAMEALFNGDGIANSDANDVPENSDSQKGSRGTKAKKRSQKKHSLNEDGDIRFAARQFKRKNIGTKSSKQPSISSEKHFGNVRNERDTNGVMTRQKRAKLDAEVSMIHKIKMMEQTPMNNAELVESSILDEIGGHQRTALTGSRLVRKRNFPEELDTSTPIAYRTRQASVAYQLKTTENVHRGCGEEMNCLMEVDACEKNKVGIGVEAANMLDAEGKSSELYSICSGELENFKSKSITLSNDISCPRRRRSCRRLSGLLNLDAQSKPSNWLEKMGNSVSMCKRSQSNAKTINVADLSKKMTISDSSDLSSIYPNPRGELSPQTVDKLGSSNENRKKISQDQMGAKEVILNRRCKHACLSPSAQDEVKASSVNLLKEATEPSKSACTSPVDCMTPGNVASPVLCVAGKYSKRSCKRSLSNSFIMREISSLCATRHEPISAPIDLRKRRDLANVRILFSQHLDDDIIKQQRKIADRLKVSVASSITDATHFITDKFLRTRNMLEAIASGKPVVTHLWLENVGRANYYIDEQKYILRDMKKEKELGFNLLVSLALACQRPLLQGRRVLITPNTKPSKEIISGLVKTVCGQALERIGRSALKDETIPDDLLILSCEEDYEVCLPFLEKGAAVYSSELLLNGIVTQKLEYERHQLFADHVKRTRSTIWLKKGGDNYIPLSKHK